MTISYWQQNNHKIQEYDFIIIGAGIAGLSAAFWLEKKYPNLRIAIIEKNFLGAGASGRNAGFVTCGSAEHFYKLTNQFSLEKAVEIWKFSEINRELLKEEIIQNNFADVDFLQTGSCTVAPSEVDWDRYQQIYNKMKLSGINVDLIDTHKLETEYGVKHFHGAIEYKNDGIIHPYKLLLKIRSLLKTTDIFENEEIFDIQNKSTSTELKTQKATYRTSKLFVCVNGYLGLLLPEFKNLITPQRSQVILTEKLPLFVKGPCYLTKYLCYFRQLPTGELLVGGFRSKDLQNENTFTDDITETIQNALKDFTRNYFSQAKEINIKSAWSGIMGFTSDGQMLIGSHPQNNMIHLMAGCSGHGMGLSFHAAKLMIENIEGKIIPEHLSINRFNQLN